MPPYPALTLPTATDIEALLLQPPHHSYEAEEIDRFLRDLHETHPHSRLLVSCPAILIETHASTGARVLLHGHIAIIEQLDTPDDASHYMLQLLGGPTGYESFYLTDTLRFAECGQSGWSACAGTPGRWNACYVLPASMKHAYEEFAHASLQGPQVTYPAPLTDEERRAQQEHARLRFLASLKRSAAMN